MGQPVDAFVNHARRAGDNYEDRCLGLMHNLLDRPPVEEFDILPNGHVARGISVADRFAGYRYMIEQIPQAVYMWAVTSRGMATHQELMRIWSNTPEQHQKQMEEGVALEDPGQPVVWRVRFSADCVYLRPWCFLAACACADCASGVCVCVCLRALACHARRASVLLLCGVRAHSSVARRAVVRVRRTPSTAKAPSSSCPRPSTQSRRFCVKQGLAIAYSFGSSQRLPSRRRGQGCRSNGFASRARPL